MTRLTRRGAVLAVGVALLSSRRAAARTGPRKPKPPPGTDPGGIAVAIIGAGTDYLRPDIARRLARDGEGEMIGWDIVDDDPLPLEAEPAAGRRIPLHAGTGVASLLLAEAPAARLIPVRLPDANAPALGGALGFVRATPARVAAILLSQPPSEPAPLFLDVARASPGVLIVVPAEVAARLLPPGALVPANVLRCEAVTEAGAEFAAMPATASPSDIAVPITSPHLPSHTRAAFDHVAAVRLAALAARLLAQQPRLQAELLRAAILALAQPPVMRSSAGGAGNRPWLADIGRLPHAAR